MKVHYHKPITDRLIEVIEEARAQDRVIDHIELSEPEWLELSRSLMLHGFGGHFINTMNQGEGLFNGVKLSLEKHKR